MKKTWSLILLGFIALAGLTACGTTDKSSSSEQSKQQTSTSQSTTASSQPVVISHVSMDIDALMQGDYDSLIGTWQNSQGETLVFNSKGLVAEQQNLLGRGTIMDGIFETGYVDGDLGEVQLYMVPKETSLAPTLLTEDPTDSTQDRILTKPAQAELNPDAYYRLSQTANAEINPLKNTETGIQLESGPKTIDYANSILGENNWHVVEGNYTRTEAVPYNVIEGDDESRYTIYQNGVILNANYEIIYQP